MTDHAVLEALAEAARYTRSDFNVVGHGFGLRKRRGLLEDELCVRVLVRRKFSTAALVRASGSRPIPPRFRGIPTDVVQAIPSPSTFRDFAGTRDTSYYDPLVGGPGTVYAEAPLAFLGGTLGLICRDDSGHAVGLSNWHVWGGEHAEVGDRVGQPLYPIPDLFESAWCQGSPFCYAAPTALGSALNAAAAVAALAAALADIKDPHRRGQEATVVAPGAATTGESVDAVIGTGPQIPWPGLPFELTADWTYSRQTSAGAVEHQVSEARRNAQFLLGTYACLNKWSFSHGETIEIRAGFWEYQDRPSDSYHVVAHVIPEASTDRALRAILQPDYCPNGLGLDVETVYPGQIAWAGGLASMQPGTSLPSPQQFRWLSVVSSDQSELRVVNNSGGSAGELLIDKSEGIVFRHLPSSEVRVQIVHNGTPVRLTAYDATGAVVGDVFSPSVPGTHELMVAGMMINRCVVSEGGGDASVIGYGVLPHMQSPVGMSVDANFANSILADGVLDHFSSPTQWQVFRHCYSGRVKIPQTEPAGRYLVYLTIQNNNTASASAPPEEAARIIGGHMISSSAVAGSCSVTVVAEQALDVT